MKLIKNLILLIITIIFLTTLIDSEAALKKTSSHSHITSVIKNVILLIPDGTSVTHITFSRWYNGGFPLAVDQIASGLIRTYTADAIITDSAPAATAMATGYKTLAQTIGIMPSKKQPFLWGVADISDEDEERPAASVLEAAKLAGKSVGLVATAFIEHATPASFSAHSTDRDDFESIAKQQVYNGIDVALGGGLKFITKENRNDKEDLIQILKAKGYQLATSLEEMNKINSGKIWGTFAFTDMSNDIDRDKSIEPSIEEMTKKAISLLKKNKKGFFLMVEGSKIDWSSHRHDPVGIATEFIAFDKAVKVALDFAKKRNDTVVIVSPDHGNGGFSIGSTLSDKSYRTAPMELYLSATKKAKHTVDYIIKEIKEIKKIDPADHNDQQKIKNIIIENYLPDLTSEEFNLLIKTPFDKIHVELVKLIQTRNAIAFTTNEHTGEDVPLFSYHPNPLKKLQGVILNTDIAKYISTVLKLNLKQTTKELYFPVDLNKTKNIKLEINNTNNPILILDNVRLPINTNIALIDNGNSNSNSNSNNNSNRNRNKEYLLPGLTLFNKDKNRVYFSKKVFDYINSKSIKATVHTYQVPFQN